MYTIIIKERGRAMPHQCHLGAKGAAIKLAKVIHNYGQNANVVGVKVVEHWVKQDGTSHFEIVARHGNSV